MSIFCFSDRCWWIVEVHRSMTQRIPRKTYGQWHLALSSPSCRSCWSHTKPFDIHKNCAMVLEDLASQATHIETPDKIRSVAWITKKKQVGGERWRNDPWVLLNYLSNSWDEDGAWNCRVCRENGWNQRKQNEHMVLSTDWILCIAQIDPQ